MQPDYKALYDREKAAHAATQQDMRDAIRGWQARAVKAEQERDQHMVRAARFERERDAAEAAYAALVARIEALVADPHRTVLTGFCGSACTPLAYGNLRRVEDRLRALTEKEQGRGDEVV